MIDPVFPKFKWQSLAVAFGIRVLVQILYILGHKLTINQTVFIIVGVMPKSFRGMDRDQRPDVFIPLQSEPSIDAPFSSIAAGYQVWWIRLGARLKEGVSLQQADAFLKTSSRSIIKGEATPPNFKFNSRPDCARRQRCQRAPAAYRSENRAADCEQQTDCVPRRSPWPGAYTSAAIPHRYAGFPCVRFTVAPCADTSRPKHTRSDMRSSEHPRAHPRLKSFFGKREQPEGKCLTSCS
jgi:hypothetical protein